MAKDPRSQSFWDDEARRLGDDVTPFVLNMYLAGAKYGEGLLPPRFRVAVDWDVFNERAIDYLRRYNFDLVGGITETSRKQTQRAIESWVRSGNKFDSLVAMLDPIFGGDRAKRIATTEVTKIFADGNTEAWRATGQVAAREWRASQDERVCPICGEDPETGAPGLHGTTAKIGEPFIHPTTGVQYDNPPAHVNCRCSLVPIVGSDEDYIKGLFD